jgi:hypothetical protein
MECLSHLGNQGEQQTEEMYFPSNNSTVSVGSDTLPAMNGRRKCGNAMEKIRNHKVSEAHLMQTAQCYHHHDYGCTF